MEFLSTWKGNPCVVYGGYSYRRRRVNKCGSVFWSCVNEKKLRCHGTLTTNNNQCVKVTAHQCESDDVALAIRRARTIKKRRRRKRSLTVDQEQLHEPKQAELNESCIANQGEDMDYRSPLEGIQSCVTGKVNSNEPEVVPDPIAFVPIITIIKEEQMEPEGDESHSDRLNLFSDNLNTKPSVSEMESPISALTNYTNTIPLLGSHCFQTADVPNHQFPSFKSQVKASTKVTSGTNSDFTDLKSVVNKLEMISDKLTAAALGDQYEQFAKYLATLLRGVPKNRFFTLKKKFLSEVFGALATNSEQSNDSPGSARERLECERALPAVHNVYSAPIIPNAPNTSAPMIASVDAEHSSIGPAVSQTQSGKESSVFQSNLTIPNSSVWMPSIREVTSINLDLNPTANSIMDHTSPISSKKSDVKTNFEQPRYFKTTDPPDLMESGSSVQCSLEDAIASVETGRFLCEMCSSHFTTSIDLKGHYMKTHPGTKPSFKSKCTDEHDGGTKNCFSKKPFPDVPTSLQNLLVSPLPSDYQHENENT